MKPKKGSKKLILNRETIADLNIDEMRGIPGGYIPQTEDHSSCDPEHPMCETWWEPICISTVCGVNTATGGFGTGCQCPT